MPAQSFSTNLFEHRRAMQLLKAMWLCLALIMAIDIIWIHWENLTVSMPGISSFVLAMLGFIIVVSWVSMRKNEAHVFMFTQALLLCVSATISVGWLSYLGTRLALPLVDTSLIEWDHRMGFDWREYLNFVIAHPQYQLTLRTAYISEAFEVFLMIMILSLAKKVFDLQRLLIAMLISSIICTVIAILVPAAGGYMFYDIHPEAVLYYPAAGRMHEYGFLGMRDHSVSVLYYPMQGMVKFPSFHASLAVFMMWAAYYIRGLFWPMFALNNLILMATPVHGGHYLTDTIGGVVLGILTILLVRRLLLRETYVSS